MPHEEIKYKGIFVTHYEAETNKDKWKRDMIGISSGEDYTKYYHCGGWVLHPWRNWLFGVPSEGISSPKHNPNLASFELRFTEFDKEFLNTFREGKYAGGIYQSDFNRKLPLINFKHLDVLNYEVIPSYRGLRSGVKYKIEFKNVETSELEEEFENIKNDSSLLWLRGGSPACYEISDENIIKFQEIHKSLTDDMINFLPFDDSELIKAAEEDAKWEEGRKADLQKALREGKDIENFDYLRQYGRDLYLMKNKRNGLYKIGISVEAARRERTLQSDEPEIELVGKWNYLSPYEKEWHEYFDEQHIRGEWFALTKAQIRFFCYYCRKEKYPPHKKTETGDLEAPHG